MDSDPSLADQEQLERDMERQRLTNEAIERFMALAYTNISKYPMIYLLVTILFFQIVLILLVVFNSVFREDLVSWLDGLKTKRVQLVVKLVCGILFVGVVYNIYEAVTAIDQVVLVFDILEALLMGFSGFLMLMTNNLHHYEYIREAVELEKNISAEEWRQYRNYYHNTKTNALNAVEANRIREEISRLKRVISNLKDICYTKENQVKSKLANLKVIENKIEGIRVEYNRVEGYNEDIRDQMRDINEKLSRGYEEKCYFYDSLLKSRCRKRV